MPTQANQQQSHQRKRFAPEGHSLGRIDQDLQSVSVAGAGIALILIALTPPAIYAVDGNSMLVLAESIVRHGTIAVPATLGKVGRGGLHYSIWYPLLSIMALPLVATGDMMARLFHLPPHYTAGIWALMLNALLTAATATVTGLLALRLGASRERALTSALAFAFGTVAMVYSRSFFADPLLALITVSGIYLAVDNGRHSASIILISAMAVLAKPTGVVLGPLLSLHGMKKGGGLFRSVPGIIGTATGLALYMSYNYARFLNVLDFGQPTLFSLRNVPIGLAGLLVSPGRGVFWYCPPVLALVGVKWRALKRCDLDLVIAVAAAYLLLYSLWQAWSGGWSWGPRLLLPALPGLIALGAFPRKGWNKALAILALVGFVTNSPNLVSYYERYYQEATVIGQVSEEMILWNPVYSPIVAIWASAFREVKDAQTADISRLVERAGSRGNERDPQSWRVLRTVALWWWILPALRVSRYVGFGAMTALIVAGVILIVKSFPSGHEPTESD